MGPDADGTAWGGEGEGLNDGVAGWSGVKKYFDLRMGGVWWGRGGRRQWEVGGGGWGADWGGGGRS